MAKSFNIRNIYHLLLGLSVVSFVLMLIGWDWDMSGKLHRDETILNSIHHEINSSAAGPIDVKGQWWAKQARRQHNLRQTCRLYRNFGENHTISELIKKNQKSFYNFVVDDKNRLLYTWIGEISWTSAFPALKGKYKRVEDVPLKKSKADLVRLSSFREEGIKQRLAKYTKVIFVSHPFERLLSAYRSKLEEPNDYYPKRVGVRIIRRFRKNATAEALKKGTDVTFLEFVRYLAMTKPITNLDHYWRPGYKMVLPCTVRFDYIGKLETWEEDAKNILQETHVNHLVHFKPTKSKVSHNERTFIRYYSQIPSGDLVRLYMIFKPDFLLFGYRIPSSLKEPLNDFQIPDHSSEVSEGHEMRYPDWFVV